MHLYAEFAFKATKKRLLYCLKVLSNLLNLQLRISPSQRFFAFPPSQVFLTKDGMCNFAVYLVPFIVNATCIFASLLPPLFVNAKKIVHSRLQMPTQPIS